MDVAVTDEADIAITAGGANGAEAAIELAAKAVVAKRAALETALRERDRIIVEAIERRGLSWGRAARAAGLKKPGIHRILVDAD